MIQSSLQINSHTRRVRLVVILICYASIVFGIPWMAFFAFDGLILIAMADGVVVAAGVMAVSLARRNKLRTASILLVVSLYLRLAGMAVFFDVPTSQVPRSIHHFFIPLAMAAYLLLKHENAWLRRGLAWTCLAAVVFFGNSNFAIVTAVAVPDSIRGPGTWINNISAMLLLYVLLYIFVAELDKLEAGLHRLRRGWVRIVHSLIPSALDRPVARFGNSISPTIPELKENIPDDGTQVWHFTQASRVLLMVHASSTLMIVIGVTFALIFASMGVWQQAYFQSALVLLGVSMAVVAGQQQSETARHWQGKASLVWLLCLMAFLLAVGVVVDIPAPDFPRSMHYWFVPLALVAYFLLRHENGWIQNGIPALCLLVFVVLASSHWGIQTRFSLTPAERPMPWMVATTALGGLYFYVFILVGDIKRLQDTLQAVLRRGLPRFLVRKRAR